MKNVGCKKCKHFAGYTNSLARNRQPLCGYILRREEEESATEGISFIYPDVDLFNSTLECEVFELNWFGKIKRWLFK